MCAEVCKIMGKGLKLLLMKQFLFTTLFSIFFLSIEAKDFTLVWHVGEKVDHYWEHDWIDDVLSPFDYDIVVDVDEETLIDRAILVLNGNNPTPIVKKYIEKGLRFGVFHVGDENYAHDTSYYPLAPFVLRAPWNKRYQHMPNVLQITLGYKTGFLKGLGEKELLSASERPYLWSFAGQVTKTTRKLMKKKLLEVRPFSLFEIATFNDPNSLTTEEYRAQMLSSVFMPCPRGFWNVDTFRLYEGLECGCIPIVEAGPNDYYANYMPDHPFLVVNTWDEAPSLMKELIKNPENLEERRKQCQEWWKNYKLSMKESVRKVIVSTFDL